MLRCSCHNVTISTTGICGNVSCTFSAYVAISLVDIFLLDKFFSITNVLIYCVVGVNSAPKNEYQDMAASRIKSKHKKTLAELGIFARYHFI